MTPEEEPRPHAPLWLLAMITFSGTLAMHVFVPALPAAAADLHVGVATMQMTVSLYILGLALGQLFYGPVSDRFGRRATLMVGTEEASVYRWDLKVRKIEGGFKTGAGAVLALAFTPDEKSLLTASSEKLLKLGPGYRSSTRILAKLGDNALTHARHRFRSHDAPESRPTKDSAGASSCQILLTSMTRFN